ncbi:MAG TPA: DMT family transporter [Acidobacteriaceae bacterium]|nr:DMT family transporter [Acidobacteriaceae bacterium]
MHGYAVALVLFSAIIHATWNGLLKGCNDRAQFMANMALAVGVLALICVPFVPFPVRSSWWCIALSSVLHLVYNLLLLENYKRSDFSSAYPIARGISPLLVTLGGFLLMQQRPADFAIFGVALISAGIVFLSTAQAKTDKYANLAALATGAAIAAYTVVDGMGIQRSRGTLSYTMWVFASYLFVPVVLLLRISIRRLTVQSMLRPAGAGIFSLAAYTLVLWATHYVDVGIVSALRETSVLWAVIIGRLFLAETLTWKRISSALMICCGVFLLISNSV